MQNYADEAAAQLRLRFGVWPEIADGTLGEFTFYVDELPMLQRHGGQPPSMAELEAALDNAT